MLNLRINCIKSSFLLKNISIDRRSGSHKSLNAPRILGDSCIRTRKIIQSIGNTPDEGTQLSSIRKAEVEIGVH